MSAACCRPTGSFTGRPAPPHSCSRCACCTHWQVRACTEQGCGEWCGCIGCSSDCSSPCFFYAPACRLHFERGAGRVCCALGAAGCRKCRRGFVSPGPAQEPLQPRNPLAQPHSPNPPAPQAPLPVPGPLLPTAAPSTCCPCCSPPRWPAWRRGTGAWRRPGGWRQPPCWPACWHSHCMGPGWG